MARTPVLYYSTYGHMETIACAVAEGAPGALWTWMTPSQALTGTEP